MNIWGVIFLSLVLAVIGLTIANVVVKKIKKKREKKGVEK